MVKLVILILCLVSFCYCKSIKKRQYCNDFTPVNGDCSRYYRCANGVSYIEQCPTGTLFDPYLKVCNWANQVSNCYQDGTYNSGYGTSYNSGYGTACNYNNDYTQVPDDCSKYFRCVNGFYQIQQCPSGTLFDSNLRQCVWADRVSTCYNNGNYYYTSGTYQQTYNQGYSDYSNGGYCTQSQDFTQVPNDCSRYYRCVNGALVTETCPNGLWFDANLKVCNWPDQVRTCYKY